MAKKSLTTEAAISVDYSKEKVEVKKEPVILPLSIDFGREDLNTMGKKLNEVIEFLNSKYAV